MMEPQGPMNPVVAAAMSGRQTALIVVSYLIGQTAFVLLQVDSIVRSKDNPHSLRWLILQQNATRIFVRFVISTAGFLFLWDNPSMIPVAMESLGVTVSPNIKSVLTMTVTPWIAIMLGFATEAALTFIPKLKNVLPSVEYTEKEKTVLKESKTTERELTTTHTREPVAVEEKKPDA